MPAQYTEQAAAPVERTAEQTRCSSAHRRNQTLIDQTGQHNHAVPDELLAQGLTGNVDIAWRAEGAGRVTDRCSIHSIEML